MTLPTIIKGKTIAQWAEHFGIPKPTLYARIRKGRSADSIIGDLRRNGIEAVPTRKPALTYTCNGQTMSLPEWSKHTGLAIRTLRYRLARGWTIERTLSTPTVQERAL